MSIQCLSKILSESIINEISDYGSIAGGAILACYRDDLDVNDIDVFVENKENYLQVLKIIQDNFTIEKVSKLRSVLEINLKEYPKIQLIMIPSIEKLLSNFDMDYIRCSYYKRQMVTTPEFKESLDTRTIKIYKPELAKFRLQKAIDKGYELPEELMLVYHMYKHETQNAPDYETITIEEAKELEFFPLINKLNYLEDSTIKITPKKYQSPAPHIKMFTNCLEINSDESLLRSVTSFPLEFCVTSQLTDQRIGIRNDYQCQYIVYFFPNPIIDIFEKYNDMELKKTNICSKEELCYNRKYIGLFSIRKCILRPDAPIKILKPKLWSIVNSEYFDSTKIISEVKEYGDSRKEEKFDYIEYSLDFGDNLMMNHVIDFDIIEILNYGGTSPCACRVAYHYSPILEYMQAILKVSDIINLKQGFNRKCNFKLGKTYRAVVKFNKATFKNNTYYKVSIVNAIEKNNTYGFVNNQVFCNIPCGLYLLDIFNNTLKYYERKNDVYQPIIYR